MTTKNKTIPVTVLIPCYQTWEMDIPIAEITNKENIERYFKDNFMEAYCIDDGTGDSSMLELEDINEQYYKESNLIKE